MSIENTPLPDSIDRPLFPPTDRPRKEVLESAMETFKEMKELLEAAKKDSDNQKISDANIKLMDVRQQLNSLRNGKNDREIDTALNMLPAAITDVATATQAQGAMDAGIQVAQAEAGEQLQAAVGEAVMGAATIVATTAENMFGALVGKETRDKIKQWNAEGLKSVEYALTSLSTELIKPGLLKTDKSSKDNGLDNPLG